MRKTKNLILKSLAVVALAGSMTACEGINLCDLDEGDLAMGDAFIETTSYFMNIVGRVDQAMRNGEVQTNGSAVIDGANVSLYTDSIVVDFGSTNVVTADGKQRKGKLVGAITGDYFTATGTVALDLVGYHVDDVPIDGTIALTNQGNATNNWIITLVSQDFTIGADYAYDANLSMEWLDGYATQDSIEDDIFEIYGSAGGASSSDSVEFDATFTENLHFERTCQYVVTKGVVDISVTPTSPGASAVATVTADFKDSDGCNNVVFLEADCDGTNVSFPQTFSGF